MNTEINYIDKTITCDESGNYILKEESCDESLNIDNDRNKIWYMIPVLFDNQNLCNKDDINDLDYSNLVGMSLLSISYKKKCYNDIENTIKTNDDLFYNEEFVGEYHKVTVKIPEDKKYLCDMIAEKGSSVINKHLFDKYFLKLL